MLSVIPADRGSPLCPGGLLPLASLSLSSGRPSASSHDLAPPAVDFPNLCSVFHPVPCSRVYPQLFCCELALNLPSPHRRWAGSLASQTRHSLCPLINAGTETLNPSCPRFRFPSSIKHTAASDGHVIPTPTTLGRRKGAVLDSSWWAVSHPHVDAGLDSQPGSNTASFPSCHIKPVS